MARLNHVSPHAWLLARAFHTVFAQAPLDEAWVSATKRAADRGALVHVLRSESIVDLLALKELSARAGFPPIGFANALTSWLDHGVSSRGTTSRDLSRALDRGHAAVLFLKKPPAVFERTGPKARGHTEGDELLEEVVRRAAKGASVSLVPQTFLWTRRAEKLGFSWFDVLFGSTEYPGDLRAVAQFLMSASESKARAADAIDVAEFAKAEADAQGEVLTRRLSYALLRRLERERRAAIGPMQKSADRVRDEVLRSPKLQLVIRDLAGPGAKEQALLEHKARGMLRAMQADPDPAAVRAIETAADTLVDKVFAGVEVDEEGLARIREAAKRSTLVLLPTHKSHVDYLLLSYVLRKHALALPVIAAGDNLSFFPIGPLFRRAGAFFIRRSFKGDRLYTAVVDAYVRRLLRDGFPIEFFLEGGRSRTGKLLPPKLGLLAMVVDAAFTLEGRDVTFVPISIGYERMMEERAYARELMGAAKRKEDARGLLRATSVLRETYGNVNVAVGELISMDALRADMGLASVTPTREQKKLFVQKLGHQVMSELNRATRVTPGSLVAMALLSHHKRGIAHLDLEEQCRRIARMLVRHGAELLVSARDEHGELAHGVVRDAAALYVQSGIVQAHVPGELDSKAKERARIYRGDDVIYTIPDDKRIALDLAKNTIVHFFVSQSLVATALFARPDRGSDPRGPVRLTTLRERVQSLSRLFKFEFMFRADASFESIFEETLADMVAVRELVVTNDGDAGAFVAPGAGHDGESGRFWVAFYAHAIKNFVESYRVAARALAKLVKGKMASKDLVQRALKIGDAMFLSGEIDHREAVSRPLVENAMQAFLDQGYLERDKDDLSLAESFQSESGAAAIEAKIAAYLPRRAGDA